MWINLCPLKFRPSKFADVEITWVVPVIATAQCTQNTQGHRVEALLLHNVLCYNVAVHQFYSSNNMIAEAEQWLRVKKKTFDQCLHRLLPAWFIGRGNITQTNTQQGCVNLLSCINFLLKAAVCYTYKNS